MNELYVVLEHNQAGGLPRLAVDDVFTSIGEAEQLATDLELDAAPRRDWYSVARLDTEIDY